MNWQMTIGAAVLLGCLCMATAAQADITGSVTLKGRAPKPRVIDMQSSPECAQQHPGVAYNQSLVVGKKQGIKNVVVSITPAAGRKLPGGVPDKPAVLNQKGCLFSPHVLAMVAGQTLLIKNSDPFFHNAHSASERNPSFTKAEPEDETGLPVTSLKEPEYIAVNCDLHPWMHCYLAVLPSRYFAVTDANGRFTISTTNLPDGVYTLTAWHERLGVQKKRIKLVHGDATADFSFKLKRASAPPIKTYRLADFVHGK